jgi:hypothetical protein
MAREAGVVFHEAVEGVEVVCSEGPRLRFQVPFVELSAEINRVLEPLDLNMRVDNLRDLAYVVVAPGLHNC